MKCNHWLWPRYLKFSKLSTAKAGGLFFWPQLQLVGVFLHGVDADFRHILNFHFQHLAALADHFPVAFGGEFLSLIFFMKLDISISVMPKGCIRAAA